MKVQTDLLFPTPVQIVDLENKMLCSSLASSVLKRTPADFKLQNASAFTTIDTLHLETDFFDFQILVNQLVEKYSTEVLGLEPQSLEMNAMWANVRKNFSKHHIHQHPNSFISGVFYVKIPEADNTGTIFFVDPRPAKNMFHGLFEKQSPISDRSWWYSPKESCLLLFPSWLEHGTDEYITSTDDYRISISFNFVLKKFIRH